MANMAYCRMENTYHDLLDCYEHTLDISSDSEKEYFLRLVALCKKIVIEAE